MSTWSPFQSPEVRDICAHMTEAEKATASRRGAIYGLWCAATLAVPFALAISQRSWSIVLLAAVLIAVHVACLPVWFRMQRRFLCSTAWARECGISPDTLALFGRQSR